MPDGYRRDSLGFIDEGLNFAVSGEVKTSEVPNYAEVWGELFIDKAGGTNFKFHVERGVGFDRAREFLKRFVSIIQQRIDTAEKCPFFEPEKANSGSLNEISANPVTTRNGSTIEPGLRVRVLSEKFDSNVADPAFSGDLVRVNLHRGTMLVRPDDLHGRPDDDTNCVGPEHNQWYGREFCPHPDAPCIDGCSFCGARLAINDHNHTRASRQGEPERYECVCFNC